MILNNIKDLNTTFKLKIKLLGNRKKCRQDVKCFSFDMVVDSDTTNYKNLVESVVEKYPSGYLGVAHIQYYDEGLKSFPEVKIDQELMSVFDKHLKRKVVYRCGTHGIPHKEERRSSLTRFSFM